MRIRQTDKSTFKSAIQQFSQNLEELREFVSVLAPFIQSKEDKVYRKRAADLLPLLSAMKLLNPEDFEEAFGEKAKKIIVDPQKYELVKHPSGRKEVKLSLKGDEQKAFNEAMKSLHRYRFHQDLFYKNCLISLVSFAELFLSHTLHHSIEKNPKIIDGKEHSFSLVDLNELKSVNDAKQRLVDKKVEDVLRGSFDDWIRFLKESAGLSMSYLDKDRKKMNEVCQRRNLLIHNGGQVNSIYLSKVHESARKGIARDAVLGVPHDYLSEAIDLFEQFFILIAAEAWKLSEPKNDDRSSILTRISLQHIREERYGIAEGLSLFIVKDKGLPEEDRLIGSVNYWQSLKWQGKFNIAEEEVQNSDFSAKKRKFKLAQMALLDKTKEFYEFLPRTIGSDGFEIEDFKDWPLFKNMRKSPKCKRFLREYEGTQQGSLKEMNKTKAKPQKSVKPTKKRAPSKRAVKKTKPKSVKQAISVKKAGGKKRGS